MRKAGRDGRSAGTRIWKRTAIRILVMMAIHGLR